MVNEMPESSVGSGTSACRGAPGIGFNPATQKVMTRPGDRATDGGAAAKPDPNSVGPLCAWASRIPKKGRKREIGVR